MVFGGCAGGCRHRQFIAVRAQAPKRNRVDLRCASAASVPLATTHRPGAETSYLSDAMRCSERLPKSV